MTSKPNSSVSLRYFLLELAFYAALVMGYFLLVLNFLGHWLLTLYNSNRGLYAFLALALMIVQGFGLEMVTRSLAGWLDPRRED